MPSAVYLVEATAPGVHRTPLVSLDMTRQLCDITLDDAPARQVAVGAAAEAAVSAGLAAGAAILAAEQLGLAQRCLDMTVAYVKERRQFARQIGSFQAIKHRLADLWTTITLARAASRYAAACLADGDPDAPVAVALAKSACCDAAVTAAQECVQLHGGIGFTWEHPAHLYLKRAKAASVAFGTPGAHRAALAAPGQPPGPGRLTGTRRQRRRYRSRDRGPRRRPAAARDHGRALPARLLVAGRARPGVAARGPVGVAGPLPRHRGAPALPADWAGMSARVGVSPGGTASSPASSPGEPVPPVPAAGVPAARAPPAAGSPRPAAPGTLPPAHAPPARARPRLPAGPARSPAPGSCRRERSPSARKRARAPRR